MIAAALFAAALLAACLAALAPPLARALPQGFASGGLVLVCAVWLLVAVLERRLPRGTVGPLWMRVALPARLALAFVESYLFTLLALTLSISLGPVDPTFPADVPPATSALWFFCGIGMMSAPGLLLPAARLLTFPLARAPLAVGAPTALALGGALGAVLWRLLVDPRTASLVERGRTLAEENAGLVQAAFLALAVLPGLAPARPAPAADPD